VVEHLLIRHLVDQASRVETMSSKTKQLTEAQLVRPPSFLPDAVQYETIMGSVAYGVSNDTSDMDVYGFCIPPKDMIFPHLRGEIPGFGEQIKRFEVWQQHHIKHVDDVTGKSREYDMSVYSIVRYFQLCMENNPNMVDSLFTPANCVLFSTPVGNLVRERRKLFLHKGSWYKFKGYAYSQMSKIQTKNPEGKRKELIEKFGYDVKFAYHVVRLLDEVEQILTEGDIDLQRNREQLKSIRRGEWKLEDIARHFTEKERELEGVYSASKLQHKPDEGKVKQLLLDCLELHFGTLAGCVNLVDPAVKAVTEIEAILARYRQQTLK
jgi:predicted nucleotidyltransferase